MRIAGAVLAGLLLVGCTAPVAPTAGPTEPGTGAVSTTPTVPSGTATSSPAPTSGYAGALALPASDGGPMLWPVGTTTDVGRNYYDRMLAIRFGFVDTTGALVVPARYEGFEYCRDASGRVASLIVTGSGRKAEVLDLAGTRIRKAPTASARCGPAGTLLFTREYGGSESGIWRDGLLEIASGKVLVGLAPKRHISVVDGTTADVSEPAGDYFLDVRTRRRTSHVGALTSPEWEAGAPGVPATAADGGLTGFIGRDGSWVLEPQLQDASAFHGRHAIITLAEERYTFLDTQFQQVGGEWSDIELVAVDRGADWEVVGYVVTGGAGTGLLDAGLHVLVAPGDVKIDCDTDPGTGACSVSAPDGTQSRALLPEGTVTAMPTGYRSLGRAFAEDVDDPVLGGAANTRVLVLATGVVVTLDGPSYCSSAGTEWAVCEPDNSEVLPTVIIDAAGRRTAFSSVEPLTDAVRGASAKYYRVTTGRYTGIVDEHGTWLYRQGRFTELED